MNDKAKKIIIPFILMLIVNLGTYYLTFGQNFSEGFNPHVGLLLISGLLLGPYGAVGAVGANILCDLIRGYTPTLAILSAIVSFGVSYLGYKLWYGNYKGRTEVPRPKLNSIYNTLIFFGIIIACAILYSLIHAKLFYLIYPQTRLINSIIEARYFLNFVNSSFIFGIIGIWICNKFNFVHLPETSKDKFNEKFYNVMGILLILSIALTLIIDYTVHLNLYLLTIDIIIICLILFIYLRKPITCNIISENHKTIPEEIMNIFLLATLFIIILGFILSSDQILIEAMDDFLPLNKSEVVISMLFFMDVILLIFLIPSFVVLRHVENKVVNPILSFAKIEDFIQENEKIESEGLVNIYSKYINEETEIGTLAKSYTDLINFNNNYIENIQEIEGEKERIKAELDIATRIQAANLPTESISNDNYIVNGYSNPAKEVGGDFFDYYELDDDNLVIVIGDASGKGVPAAILAMITQVMIKQILKHNKDPSKILYQLNNQLCENNSEVMFITLWLGIYNKNTHNLIFSNGGHNPPLIKQNDEFKYMPMDEGIALGVMEDFEYINNKVTLTEEIVLYTDGITEAHNSNNEIYGESRLLSFFNEFDNNTEPIGSLLKDITEFTKNTEQFDDMTLLYLRIKNE